MEPEQLVFMPSYDGQGVQPHKVLSAIVSVQKSHDLDVLGLTGMLTAELQHRRQGGREYLGSTSTDGFECLEDAQIILAKIMLEQSSHGDLPGYFRSQIQNEAYVISKQRPGQDWVDNWLLAEKRYIADGLRFIESIERRVNSVGSHL